MHLATDREGDPNESGSIADHERGKREEWARSWPEYEDVRSHPHRLGNRTGRPGAASQLLPLVYDELRKLAARKMAHEQPGQTLEATALVHEAYLRLVGDDPKKPWDGRGHFFAAAAEAMRRILVDRARDRHRQKRGGGRRRVRIDLESLLHNVPDHELLDFDEALQALSREDPSGAELVRLRCFAGLTLDEAAEVMGIGRRTADRYWAYARAWLCDALKGDEASR